MTKQEIENSIDDFFKVLVYEAQFLFFQKKLLHDIKNNDLRLFADTARKKIKSSIKHGRYRGSHVSDKPKLKAKKVGPARKTFVNKEIIPANKKPKLDTIPSRKEVAFDFRNHKYGELANKIDVQITFIERLLKTKGIGEHLEPNSPISESVWNIINEFVINKLNMIEAAKRKEAVTECTKPKRKNSSTPPPRKYSGGNFGKLIFTGQTP